MSWPTLVTIALCALASQTSSPKSPAAPAPPAAPTVPAPPVVPSFLDVALSDFDDAAGYPSEQRLKQWFTPAPGQKFELGKASFADREIQVARGWARLQGDLPDGAMLRFSMVNVWAPMRWYFWHGREGLMFIYYPNADHVCALYCIARSGDKPEPERHRLVALDEGRYGRAGRGTLGMLHHQGRLTFLCGDVWLFDAPLAAPPGEIYFQCEGQVRGIDVVACRGGPAPQPAREPIRQWNRPADVAWESRLGEKVALRKHADGAVELAAEEKSQAGQIDAPLSTPGPVEIVFEIDEASPGTGVFLADAEGNRLVQIGCLEDSGAKRPFLALQPGGDTSDSQGRDLRAQAVPYTTSRHWVSLVGGATAWRLGFSPDGGRFTYSGEMQKTGNGVPARVGAYCIARDKPRAIRLRSVQVRRLDALEALGPEPIQRAAAGDPAGASRGAEAAVPSVADVLDALPAPDEADAIDAWLSAIDQRRPAGVAGPPWRRAVLLGALSSKRPRGARQALVLRLVAETIDDADIPAERALAALAEMVLLVPADNRRWGEAYARLGAGMLRREHPSPYSTLWSNMLSAPLEWQSLEPIAWDDLLAAEVAPLMYAYRWTDVDVLCRRVQRTLRVRRRANDLPEWQRPLDQLSDWAWANVPRRISGWSPRPSREPRAYGPLGTATIHKEAFNTMAEVEAALRGGNVADACQVITEAVRVPPTGLTSFSPDPRLNLCFAAAIRAWGERTPKLAETIEQRYGQLARLRFQAAAAAGDVALAESVAVQFPATQAATEAQQWLGDVALSAGRFAEASGYYRRAMERVTPEQAAGLAARLRLASALVGFPPSGPSHSGVQLGDARLSAAQFDELVADLARARGAGASLRWRRIGPPLAMPAATYRSEPRGRIDGSPVAVPGGRPDESFDFGARQTSTLVLGDAMVVANRALVAAYSLSDGSPRWQQVLQGDGNQQNWPLQPFHLAVADDRLLVRRLTSAGPELCCLSAGDGKVLWTAALGGMAASDAMLGDRDAHVFQLRRSFSSRLSLELVRIDVESGHLLEIAPLIELNDVLGDRLICQSRLLRDRIVATIGGCTLCCDLQGRLRWLRHAVWAPPRDPGAYYAQCYRQVHDVPLVKDDQIFAFQPGMVGVECLDLETGVLRWKRVVPAIERLVGLSGDRLVVATRDELLALGPDGRVLWRHNTPRRFELYGCGAEAIVYARSEQTDDPGAPRRPELVWLDPATGRELASCALDVPQSGATMVGPLVVHGKRQWVFLGRGDSPANRELFELLPGA